MTRISFAVSEDVGTEILLRDVREEWLHEYNHVSPHDNAEDDESFHTANDITLADVSERSQQYANQFSFWSESGLLFNIALPSVVVQLSVVLIFPQTASQVGRHLGTEKLAGFSLGSLVGNLTCLSVMVGALTAADTLMPRAFGAGRYDEVGRLAIRGFFLCALLLVVPVIPLCTIMEWLFDNLGQDKYASALASKWIRVYLVGLPSVLLFRVIQCFLNAHNAVWPLVYASMTASFVVHPILLRTLIPYLGFLGSGWSIALTQTTMTIILISYLYLRPSTYKAEAWPGLSINILSEALQPIPVWNFLNLSLGGVLSLSEWWFWETVCFIAGSFGVVPLCVHTIAYNLVPLLFMIPLGIMFGLTVRMGTVLARGNVHRAKLIAMWSMCLIVVLGAIVSLSLFQFRIPIVKLFTSDERVIQGCQDIWPKMCYYIFVLYIFGINSAIMRALGLQWRMAAIIFVCLWCGTLPTIAYFAVRRDGRLDAVWTILPCFYTIMQVLLVLSYTTVDWSKIGEEPRYRLSVRAKEAIPPTEDSPLL